MSSIRDLVQPHIRDIKPYSPGKPVKELERELGIQESIKLASNEAPVGPSARVREAIAAELAELNRYPEDSCFYLRRALAKRLGVAENALVFAAGADGILELLARDAASGGSQELADAVNDSRLEIQRIRRESRERRRQRES